MCRSGLRSRSTGNGAGAAQQRQRFPCDVLLIARGCQSTQHGDYERYICAPRGPAAVFRREHRQHAPGMRDGFTLPAEILEGISRIVAAEQFKSPRTVRCIARSRISRHGARSRSCPALPRPGAPHRRSVSPAYSRFHGIHSSGSTARRPAHDCASSSRRARLLRDSPVLHDVAGCHAGAGPPDGTGGSRTHRSEMEAIVGRSGSRAASRNSSRSCAPIRILCANPELAAA